MQKFLLLITGGALGTLARYTVSGVVHKQFGVSFPYGTLAVNILGSLIIGLLWGLFDYYNLSSGARTFIFIGLLGSFTTFSTYMLESMNSIIGGEFKMALFNILANNLLGLASVFLGFMAVRTLITLIR